jgi:Suppressor of fused protein (SUFU)
MTTPGSEGATRKRVLAHFERHLGATAGGWSQDASGVRLPFDVLRFENAPHGGCTSYVTVGLSEHLLGGRFRLELMMGLQASVDPPLPVLVRVGEEIISRRSALLRGDVVKVAGAFEWLYATLPVYYPDGLAQFDGVAVVWLVPVSDAEARFVKQRGWDPFEDRLAEADPDLTDPGRSPVV